MAISKITHAEQTGYQVIYLACWYGFMHAPVETGSYIVCEHKMYLM